MRRHAEPRRGGGAALAIGLALLFVLTLLALVSIRGARQSAGDAAREADARTAFEAAERALAAARARLAAPPAGPAELTLPPGPDGARAHAALKPGGPPLDPPAGFSLGTDTGVRAYAVEILGTGSAPAARVRLREDVAVVGAADE